MAVLACFAVSSANHGKERRIVTMSRINHKYFLFSGENNDWSYKTFTLSVDLL